MKTVKEIKAALNYLLSAEDKILNKMVELVKAPQIVSDNIKALREYIDAKPYNDSVKKSYKGFLTNIVKLHEMELLDLEGCNFAQLRTVRQLKESLTYAKRHKVKLSEAIVVKTSPKASADNKPLRTKNKRGVKTLSKIVPQGAEGVLTIELVKTLKKEEKEALRASIIEALKGANDAILVQVAQVLQDNKALEV